MPDSRANPVQRWLYPEIERFESAAAAQVALTRASTRVMRTLRFWIGGVLVLALAAAWGVLTPVWVAWLRGGGWVGVIAAALGIGAVQGLVFGLGFQLMLRGPTRRALRAELCDRGVPLCVSCGYDLRGLRSPRCPECGAGFDPAILAESIDDGAAP